MRLEHPTSIRRKIGSASDCEGRFLWGATARVSLADLLRGKSFSCNLQKLCDRSVLLATQDPLAAAVALIELDGVARRVIICPSDLPSEHLASVIARGHVDAVVSDHDRNGGDLPDVPLRLVFGVANRPHRGDLPEPRLTEWLLLTSGTTGVPKMPIHGIRSLTAAINGGLGQETNVVWGTFYDIRRFGGLQIFFRALLGKGSLVLSSPAESLEDFLLRLAALGVTHISGTPSHWRRVLMSPRARAITPQYIRLSGEIADQAILNALGSFYPQAHIGHAFASTEAGVAFEVNDGLEGFPASLVSASAEVEMKIEKGSLRIRSARTAAGYAGEENAALADADGFVDTGDMVERRGDRYYFLGRRNGVINVGGMKVYPEEVEAVLNRHPAVSMSMVRPRRNSITGSLVAADVVLKEESGRTRADRQIANLEREILQTCRESLDAYKVPATLRSVPALELAAAGKLARPHA